MNPIIMINTIGMAVLTDALRSAAYYVSHTGFNCEWNNPRNFRSLMREGSTSLAFISGTGLDIMLNFYHLDYNAENLRDTFGYYVKRFT